MELHKQDLGNQFKGRFIQIFLCLKFFQNSIPSMYSGAYMSTEVIQSLLDDMYAKYSKAPNGCVLSLFEGNYLARTGMIAEGNTYPQNTWRNNLNLQKGIGCYAPPADLSSATFLHQSRLECRHLNKENANSLAGGHCSLCPTGASYRKEDHRKWLRIDPGGQGYAVTDLQLTSNFTPYVAPDGNRLPLLPIIVALYYDSDPGLVLGTRSKVSVEEFKSDFNLSDNEFAAYFDSSSENSLNRRLLTCTHWPTETVPDSTLTPYDETGEGQDDSTTAPDELPSPNLTGNQVPPPTLNSGWEAEQYVHSALQADGWDPYDVSRQCLGYDIFAQKGRRKLFVEVKSSLGACSPTLTSREWQQAKQHENYYVLAIIENFNHTGENTIYWIQDPANSCHSTTNKTISHGIPRSSWTQVSVTIDQI